MLVKGLAVTFVSPRELDHLRIIENVTKKSMTKKPIPSLTDVLAGNQQATISKIAKTIEENDYAEYKRVAEGLLEETDSVTLLAAALKLLTKEPDATPVKLTAVEPLRSKKKITDLAAVIVDVVLIVGENEAAMIENAQTLLVIEDLEVVTEVSNRFKFTLYLCLPNSRKKIMEFNVSAF